MKGTLSDTSSPEKEPEYRTLIEYEYGYITITEWQNVTGYIEPLNPKTPYIKRTKSVHVDDLLDKRAPHRSIQIKRSIEEPELANMLVKSAIAYLQYWGGSEEFVATTQD